MIFILLFQCSVTCGAGVQTRAVMCALHSRKSVDASLCNAATKPDADRECELEACRPEDLEIGVIIDNTVVGIRHWRIGPWSPVSGQSFMFINILLVKNFQGYIQSYLNEVNNKL